MYNHSFSNLSLYARAMPRFDDLDEGEVRASSGGGLNASTKYSAEGVKTLKNERGTTIKCTNFEGFLGAMASIGGVQQDEEVFEYTLKK